MSSDTPTIAEMNYVIGVFDCRSFSMSFITDYTAADAPKMKYHRDWGWLMRVVGKIEKSARVEICGLACKIWKHDWDEDIANVNESKLMAVYYSVYQFIVWYNNQNKNQ